MFHTVLTKLTISCFKIFTWTCLLLSQLKNVTIILPEISQRHTSTMQHKYPSDTPKTLQRHPKDTIEPLQRHPRNTAEICMFSLNTPHKQPHPPPETPHRYLHRHPMETPETPWDSLETPWRHPQRHSIVLHWPSRFWKYTMSEFLCMICDMKYIRWFYVRCDV